jgi:hypothetical protein
MVLSVSLLLAQFLKIPMLLIHIFTAPSPLQMKILRLVGGKYSLEATII